MFYGSHSVTMDAKGRVAVPKDLRDQLTAYCNCELVLTASTQDRCLVLYPKPYWDEIAVQLEEIKSRSSKQARRTKLLMLGYYHVAEMDGNNRMLIPTQHRDYAGLDRKLLIIGQGKSFEVWDEDRFKEWVDSDIDEPVPDDLAGLDF
ncbi:division/cell wall cluster transcriptional repressor MraZ [Halioxenophilus sp. WMMB6]|uniref:division/cell wall cluster transcriptional repressor MraZ n=1 Tax=Halioxenophilus sp. WMMB6 TaxID=3073815 RepID=UPI00295EDB8D|nr:division/cell wall cluster transcriptional repressor MraZ [Halioxenophilus sp. WMMB6]